MAFEGNLPLPEHHREQVVEVVCDSSCELPDRFHALCVAEPLLGLLAGAHVNGENAYSLGDRFDAQLEMSDGAVRESEGVFQCAGRAVLETPAQQREQLGVFDPGVALHHRPPNEIFRGALAVPGSGSIHMQIAPVRTDDLEALEQRVENPHHICGGKSHRTSYARTPGCVTIAPRRFKVWPPGSRAGQDSTFGGSVLSH